MDWQDLVNKAAEVELKARVRGTRTSAFKVTTSLCCSSPNYLTVHANVADSADTNSALEAAKKALNEARKKYQCEFYKIFGYLTKECQKAGNTPVPTYIKKRRANNNNNGANKKPRGDNNSNKPQSTPANIGFVEDIEEMDIIIAADPQRLPTVDLEKRQIKKYLADARRRKGYHYYLDSGAGRYVSGYIEAFEYLEDLEEPVRVNGFEGSAIVRQQGTLRLQINVNGYYQTIRVSNILYYAPFPFTLLSVKAFSVRGYQFTFNTTEAWITRKSTNKVVAHAVSPRTTDLYRLLLQDGEIPYSTTTSAYYTSPSESSE